MTQATSRARVALCLAVTATLFPVSYLLIIAAIDYSEGPSRWLFRGLLGEVVGPAFIIGGALGVIPGLIAVALSIWAFVELPTGAAKTWAAVIGGIAVIAQALAIAWAQSLF